jgi:hypothetical protein
MAELANRSVLREAALELGARAARAERGGKRPRRLTLNVDSQQVEGEPGCATGSNGSANGQQLAWEWNGLYRSWIYQPLVTSVAETGDILAARLRLGAVGTADGALGAILAGERPRALPTGVAPLRRAFTLLDRSPRPPTSTRPAAQTLPTIVAGCQARIVRASHFSVPALPAS